MNSGNANGSNLLRLADAQAHSNVRIRLERKCGETKYYVTQCLTGYDDYYEQNPHRVGLDNSPNCLENGGMRENREHVVFHCSGFALQRRILNQALGIAKMLKSKENWLTASFAIVTIFISPK